MFCGCCVGFVIVIVIDCNVSLVSQVIAAMWNGEWITREDGI